MRVTILLSLLLLLCHYGKVSAHHALLSEEAKISLLTASPGANLHTAFGHSALWVYDSVSRINEVYNWGTFDFNTPHFVLKFLQGRLEYFLSVVPLNAFLRSYQGGGRAMVEQELMLSHEEKIRIYRQLLVNRQPENTHYLYDFFYDNCATRIRDLVEEELAPDWGPDPHAHQQRSFRQMLKPYTEHAPWLGFGIDILLGIPSDKKAKPFHYMFLPDEMLIAFQNARHADGRPLVAEYRTILEAQLIPPESRSPGPLLIFWLLLVLSVLAWRFSPPLFFALGKVYYFLLGLLGLLLFFMWFLSDHYATAINMNILWALPTHIYFVFSVGRNGPGRWSGIYFRSVLIVHLILLIGWPFNPQGFHPASFPMILLAALFALASLRSRKNAVSLQPD